MIVLLLGTLRVSAQEPEPKKQSFLLKGLYWVKTLIDSPGIRGFGTFDIEKEELTSYFKEIFRFSKNCRFSNCTHTHEPGCAVLKAVEDHYIALSRYNSYLSMLDDKDEDKYRKGY